MVCETVGRCCMFVLEPLPATIIDMLPLSDTSLTVKLAYHYSASFAQCSEFVLLTSPASSKKEVPCMNMTSVELNGLHSNTNYRVTVTAVATFSDVSVYSVRSTGKSWTCEFSFYRFSFFVLSFLFLRFYGLGGGLVAPMRMKFSQEEIADFGILGDKSIDSAKFHSIGVGEL